MDMSIPLGPVEPGSAPAGTERDRIIRERYLKGETLASIGLAFGVSAERIRKIVKRFGLDKSNAGLAIRNSSRPVKVARPPHSLRTYGCTDEELESVSIELRQAFLQQRTNVRRTSAVAWELTLLQWVEIWGRSGRWEERGQGPLKFGLSRVDTAGPYSAENVSVARNHDSAMRGRSLKSAERRKQAYRKSRNEKWIREMARILKKAPASDGRLADSADQQ